MNVQELIDIHRQRSDDAVFPFHASDELLIKLAAEAEKEACLRARLIYDETGDICSIPIITDVSRYEIDPSIFHIDHVSYTSPDGGIFEVESTGADLMVGADMTVHGRPYKASHLADNVIGVWPVPNIYHNGTLKLKVYRTPIYPVEELDDDFEIHERHHENLVDWLLYRVYMSKDLEMYDPTRAATALTEFERHFGTRRNANVARRHREKRRVTAVMGY